MSFTPEFLEDIRQRVPLSDIVGRRVKLVKKGREFSGLCPFHTEKSPSFTVNDDKAFYHCFGCGAHGDVIRFVVEQEGLPFPEAVEKLAGIAGLDVPRDAPASREAQDERSQLYKVMEAAAAWFESQLAGQAGRAARDYLANRGLKPDTIKSFRLGFAPDHRAALKDALLARGFTVKQLVETGMLIAPEEGSSRDPYDRFRDRVMFPIADRRGQIVAFGGRAMQKDAPSGQPLAKYLNSPETPLFHKGRLLYNLPNARAASRQTDRMIVVEGYMDVIALAQAGIKDAVAPLGTAFTEDQMAEIWKLAPDPVLCFDGDAAGVRAAHRALDRALPQIAHNRTLRFAFLPAGEDPDSLVMARGAAAMNDVLAQARPLHQILWEHERDATPLDTPERRAAFKRRLRLKIREIQDGDTQGEYKEIIETLLAEWQAVQRPARGPSGPQGRSNAARPFAPGSAPRGGRRGFAPFNPLAGGASAEFAARNLSRQPDRSRLREQMLLAGVILRPALLESHAEDLAHLSFENPDLDKMRHEIIGIAPNLRAIDGPNLDTDRLKRHLEISGYRDSLDRLLETQFLKRIGFMRPDTAYGDAEEGWLRLAALHQRLSVLKAELASAEQVMAHDLNDQSYQRLLAVKADYDNAIAAELAAVGQN